MYDRSRAWIALTLALIPVAGLLGISYFVVGDVIGALLGRTSVSGAGLALVLLVVCVGGVYALSSWHLLPRLSAGEPDLTCVMLSSAISCGAGSIAYSALSLLSRPVSAACFFVVLVVATFFVLFQIDSYTVPWPAVALAGALFVVLSAGALMLSLRSATSFVAPGVTTSPLNRAPSQNKPSIDLVPSHIKVIRHGQSLLITWRPPLVNRPGVMLIVVSPSRGKAIRTSTSPIFGHALVHLPKTTGRLQVKISIAGSSAKPTTIVVR